MADVTAIGVAEWAEIGASRRRILEAGDEEPSRLKRRLSEGTLRQPCELAQAMRLARQSVTGQGTAERTALAQPRHSEVAAALHRNRRAARSVAGHAEHDNLHAARFAFAKAATRAESALGAGVLTLVAHRCTLSVMGRGFP